MTSAELRRQLAQLLVVRGSGFSRDSQRRYPRWEPVSYTHLTLPTILRV